MIRGANVSHKVTLFGSMRFDALVKGLSSIVEIVMLPGRQIRAKSINVPLKQLHETTVRSERPLCAVHGRTNIEYSSPIAVESHFTTPSL